MAVTAAILVAGQGTRFGVDKTQILLRGKPLWRYSFDTFSCHPEVDQVGLVCRSELVSQFQAEAPEAAFVVAGGSSRQESAAIATGAAGNAEIVLLHDGARPFATAQLISRVLDAVRRSSAAAPGIPVTDTLRSIGERETRLIDRAGVVAMQTPQGARTALLRKAFSLSSHDATDDLGVLEQMGIEGEIVAGEANNIKITTPEDLARGVAILGPLETRTGIGYDVHAFSADPSRPLYLGGVHFEGARGLEGHSDADVLLHAIVDALLGAAALGDIGQLYPNSDAQWRNRSSIYFLEGTKALLERESWRILNIDATLIAESPKVMERAQAIRNRVSAALGLEPGRVSIKATTNERLGSIGRGEGIAAFAVATICESI